MKVINYLFKIIMFGFNESEMVAFKFGLLVPFLA